MDDVCHARLLACAGDGSFIAAASPENRILFTPRDEDLPQRWIEAHPGLVSALTASGVYEVPWFFGIIVLFCLLFVLRVLPCILVAVKVVFESGTLQIASWPRK